MERNYLHEMLPFLTQIEKKRQEQFEIYFHSAPLWVMEALEVENRYYIDIMRRMKHGL